MISSICHRITSHADNKNCPSGKKTETSLCGKSTHIYLYIHTFNSYAFLTSGGFEMPCACVCAGDGYGYKHIVCVKLKFISAFRLADRDFGYACCCCCFFSLHSSKIHGNFHKRKMGTHTDRHTLCSLETLSYEFQANIRFIDACSVDACVFFLFFWLNSFISPFFAFFLTLSTVMDQLDKILRIYVRWLYVQIPMDGEKRRIQTETVQTNGITSLNECASVCLK